MPVRRRSMVGLMNIRNTAASASLPGKPANASCAFWLRSRSESPSKLTRTGTAEGSPICGSDFTAARRTGFSQVFAASNKAGKAVGSARLASA